MMDECLLYPQALIKHRPTRLGLMMCECSTPRSYYTIKSS